jgi:hypothetical protein
MKTLTEIMKHQSVITAALVILFFAGRTHADIALEPRPLTEIARECQQAGVECESLRPMINQYYGPIRYPIGFYRGLERSQIRESQKSIGRSMRNVDESIRNMRTNIERIKPFGRGLRY